MVASWAYEVTEILTQRSTEDIDIAVYVVYEAFFLIIFFRMPVHIV